MVEAWFVPHTHWDREWHRPFQDFRGRLVDTVDAVLEQLEQEPGWSFTLDGQSIVAEDYLAVRPGRRAELAARVAEGRLGLGPWWVQPDSFLPAGETHVRNLLEGRRVAEELGGCSRVAHLPDSFGHPATLPMLFAGFGLGPFTYWRGHGGELDELPATWTWRAPDGSTVLAHHLAEGYFAAACLDAEPLDAAVARLEAVTARLVSRSRGEPVVLLNGVDHMLPDESGPAVVQALLDRGHDVRVGRLDDFAVRLPAQADPTWAGELSGGRLANLLPGVWSARMPLKLWARRCESLLLGWAEPLAALSLLHGGPDERPALRAAWREVIANSAHDSIGGCSVDLVHEQGAARYTDALGLAGATVDRLLQRLAGAPTSRRTPDSLSLDLAVWNPSPRRRTDVLRVPLDGHPPIRNHADGGSAHPLLVDAFAPRGFTVDGRPARLVASDDPVRMRVLPGQPVWDLEVVVDDVPALGWRRLRLAPTDVPGDVVDDGTEIEGVEVAADGTLTVGGVSGLLGVEDHGDRGDSYDCDPLPDGDRCVLVDVRVQRRRHEGTGIQELRVTRVLEVPVGLVSDRSRRAEETTRMVLEVTARVAPGVDRVDLDVRLHGTARDHRLRLLVPGGDAPQTLAAGTFCTVLRGGPLPADAGWKHLPPSTFCHQGWVRCGPSVLVAPGLPEAEVRPDGVVALTLVRSIGWLSQMGLTTRPEAAGPALEVPGAQVPEGVRARLALLPWAEGTDPTAASLEAELGLRGGWAGPAPLVPEGRDLLRVEPAGIVLSSCLPWEDGVLVRVLNPGSEPVTARLRHDLPVGRARSVRLDGGADGQPIEADTVQVTIEVPSQGLRSVVLDNGPAAGEASVP